MDKTYLDIERSKEEINIKGDTRRISEFSAEMLKKWEKGREKKRGKYLYE